MDVLGFRHPNVLAALVVPLLLLAWTWRRRGRRIALPFDHGRRAASRWLSFVLLVFESAAPLALAAAIVLLAGPQAFSEPRTRRVLTNIEFCVDVSGSMTAKFEDGDRYAAAMDAINGFVAARQGDAFSLSFFGNNVLHWCPLTSDASAIRCAPPFMHPRRLPSWFGGTEIGRALLACRKVLLEREEGDRMIVLVTDGYSADLGGGRDEEIGRRLRDDRIVVYTIHVAEPPIPGEVTKIAAITEGEAFASHDQASLEHVFARIDAMQKTRVEKTLPEATDDFVPWCLAASAVIGAWLLAALAGLRTTPW